MAFGLLNDSNEAQDMVQEVYVKLWEKRLELKELNNPEGFVVTVMKNYCLDHLRKAKLQTDQIADSQAFESASIEETMDSREDLNRVESIIGRLPANQQTVLELRYKEDLSVREIEERTGLNEAHIKVLLSRARKTVKEAFNK